MLIFVIYFRLLLSQTRVQSPWAEFALASLLSTSQSILESEEIVQPR